MLDLRRAVRRRTDVGVRFVLERSEPEVDQADGLFVALGDEYVPARHVAMPHASLVDVFQRRKEALAYTKHQLESAGLIHQVLLQRDAIDVSKPQMIRVPGGLTLKTRGRLSWDMSSRARNSAPANFVMSSGKRIRLRTYRPP